MVDFVVAGAVDAEAAPRMEEMALAVEEYEAEEMPDVLDHMLCKVSTGLSVDLSFCQPRDLSISLVPCSFLFYGDSLLV